MPSSPKQTQPVALPVVVDLADADAITDAVQRVHHELSGIDILVNAAGTGVPGPVVDLDAAGWDRVLDVNLLATFLLARRRSRTCRSWAAARSSTSDPSPDAGDRPTRRLLRADVRAHPPDTSTGRGRPGPSGIRAWLLYPGAMDTSWGCGRRAIGTPSSLARQPFGPDWPSTSSG